MTFTMVQAYWQIGRIIVEHENVGEFQLGNRVPDSSLLSHALQMNSLRDFLSALCSR